MQQAFAKAALIAVQERRALYVRCMDLCLTEAL